MSIKLALPSIIGISKAALSRAVVKWTHVLHNLVPNKELAYKHIQIYKHKKVRKVIGCKGNVSAQRQTVFRAANGVMVQQQQQHTHKHLGKFAGVSAQKCLAKDSKH